MKSILSNVCGMAAVVACLVLGCNHPAGAEEQVKEEVQKQTRVIVVQAKGETDIADAVKKSLGDKLKGLPDEVQAQIMHKLKGIETHQPLNIQVVPVHEVQTIQKSQKSDGEKRAIAIAVSVDGDEVSAKDISKEITVTVEDGKVILNGKPIANVHGAGQKAVRVEVKNSAGKDAKQAMQRKMVFIGQDGKMQEIELDVNVDAHHVVKGATDDAKAIKADPHAESVHGLPEGKISKHAKPEIHVRALTLGADKLVSPHAAAVLSTGAHADKAHAAVTKRLKGIESELKKIRKLLEKMQDKEGHDQEEHEDEDAD